MFALGFGPLLVIVEVFERVIVFIRQTALATYLVLWEMARRVITYNSCLPWCGKRKGLSNNDGRARSMCELERNAQNYAPETYYLSDFLVLYARGNDEKIAQL